ncbi:hypothetical protein C7271_27025, partial [filamentous cyanobacterium CCP5]
MSHSDPHSNLPVDSRGDAAKVPPHSAQALGDAQGERADGWETVQFPNAVDVDAIPSIPPAEPSLDSGEMVRLIQDLNQCNDALLARVAELEDALE